MIQPNMAAWILGQNTVIIINKYTIIQAQPSDFEFQKIILLFPLTYQISSTYRHVLKRVLSRIKWSLSRIKRVPSRQASCLKKVSSPHNFQNQKLYIIPENSPFLKTVKILTQTISPRHSPRRHRRPIFVQYI